jgi:hypothetical protein
LFVEYGLLSLDLHLVLGSPICRVFTSISRSSSQSIIGITHGLHGLTQATNASTLGASSSIELGTLGVASFVGTFGSLGK